MKKKKKGFTLLELIVVLAILGSLAIIALPQIGRIVNTYRLNSAVRVVWNDIQNAKMQAIKANQSIVVTFVNNTTYSYPRPQDPRGTFVRNLADEYPGVTISYTGGGSMSFNSRGIVPVSDVGTVKVMLAGKTKQFTIAWTGRIGVVRDP